MIDVCLLLEGTYPYVAGGVSTWVHQLILAMQDIRFGIVYIAPSADYVRELKYKIPKNVVHFSEVNLHTKYHKPDLGHSPTQNELVPVSQFYKRLLWGDISTFDKVIPLFQGERPLLNAESFFYSKVVWDILIQIYTEQKYNVSFLDFFWTFRSTHMPLLQIMTCSLPAARIYHAVSTGYAGLLGCVAKNIYPSKFLITEHGLYTHERLLEIMQSQWIFSSEQKHFRAIAEIPFFKKWWTSLFTVMSRLAYAHADQIYALYEENRLKQVAQGAPWSKTQVIPNGVYLPFYEKIQKKIRQKFHIGFVGRVVPIKDVKTFIQACLLVKNKTPDVHFFIMGPTEEDEDYFLECQAMVRALQLETYLTFTGKLDIREALSNLDLVVLTSISEAQPYAILEANVVGLPVVATNVGACENLLNGFLPEDVELGKSGLITLVAQPEATAQAIIDLKQNQEMYKQMSLAGRKRVQKFYNQEDLLSRYLNIYERNR